MASDTRFKKGKSGNKAGRPKVVEEFRARCRKIVDEEVIDMWHEEIQLKEREVITPAGPMTMVTRGKHAEKAADQLSAYGYGKPTQRVELAPEDMSDDEVKAALISAAEQLKEEGKGTTH